MFVQSRTTLNPQRDYFAAGNRTFTWPKAVTRRRSLRASRHGALYFRGVRGRCNEFSVDPPLRSGATFRWRFLPEYLLNVGVRHIRASSPNDLCLYQNGAALLGFDRVGGSRRHGHVLGMVDPLGRRFDGDIDGGGRPLEDPAHAERSVRFRLHVDVNHGRLHAGRRYGAN